MSSTGHKVNRHDAMVIGGASVGTVFEWYDFYLYGSLATYITKYFFSGVNQTTGYIFALLAFAAGFAVRPFGALIFGRLGDLWGRKNTFLVTMTLMGLSTFAVGLLPSYANVGVAAPIALIAMRLIQGLAVGGEYGGAATYVAEHAPPGRRGFYTSWVQTTATGGLLLSLLVILGIRIQLGTTVFDDWGWRVPFLGSGVLLAISLWLRMRLNESPVFQRMVTEGRTSRQPLTDAFANWDNLRLSLIALFGLTAGQAVVWYCGQFYILFFVEKVLQVDGAITNKIVALGLLIGTPLFVLFGWLSDKVSRKWVLMGGALFAVVTFIPLFHTMTLATNPDLAAASARAPIRVVADPANCSVQFDPVGKKVFNTSCDLIKTYLAKAGVPYSNQAAPAGALAEVRVGSVTLASFEGRGLAQPAFAAGKTVFETKLGGALAEAGYPKKADPAKINWPLAVLVIVLLMVPGAMMYGPMAAMLVEMFPAKIRYTAMSLPYHLGNGWFGGFLPTVAFAMVAATGDIYYGLWYPIVVAIVVLIVGTLFLRDRRQVSLDD